MDSEVDKISEKPESLSIDTETGFELFYCTFEGELNLKNDEAIKAFKISFMVEGKVFY